MATAMANPTSRLTQMGTRHRCAWPLAMFSELAEHESYLLIAANAALRGKGAQRASTQLRERSEG